MPKLAACRPFAPITSSIMAGVAGIFRTATFAQVINGVRFHPTHACRAGKHMCLARVPGTIELLFERPSSDDRVN